MSVAFARKGPALSSPGFVWWRDNFVGVAFSSESKLPVSDLDERLRKSEQTKNGSFSAASKSLSAKTERSAGARAREIRGAIIAARCAKASC